jgi:peptide/bleomycin uptake transporter
VFKAFFPDPKVYFPAAAVWTAFAMLVWFLFSDQLAPVLSLGPLIAIQPTETDPAPFFDESRVWLYQYVLMSGYLFCIPWLFYKRTRWFRWSVVGSVTIVEIVYFNVQISAWLNSWYGDFYNLIQAALGDPEAVTLEEYLGFLVTVAIVLTAQILVLVVNAFFNAHYLFRWRRAMSFYYLANWKAVRHIEGASQRIQEDTQEFSNIVESIGLSFIDSVMTLIVFLPLLWGLSANITELPIFGAVDGSLVWVALVSAALGTVLLGVVGIRLPGLTFHNQRVEAAFRKELVYGEDYDEHARPPAIRDFFQNVQKNYFRLYFHYTYFNVARYAYLQGAVFIPYIALGPSIVVAAITLGLFQQILQAFGQVSDSFRFLVYSWTSIIRLISVYKRLEGFESHLPDPPVFANDYDDPRFLESWDKVPDPETSTTPIDFRWAMIHEPRDGVETGYVSVWYDLLDKDKFPGSRTREHSFPYSSELAASVNTATEAIRGGRKVEAELEFFEQPKRVKMEMGGLGARGEIDVTHGRAEAPEMRIRPISVSFSAMAAA